MFNSAVRSFYWAALLVSGCVVLSGCEKKHTPDDASSMPGASVVLASVNGEDITRDDLLFSLERTFAQADAINADGDLQQKVLESLIASKAMKQLVLQQLSAAEKTRIAKLAKAYEEELYVKEYLQRHVVPEPVTLEMVQRYYDENPAEFGAEVFRDFELLSAPPGLNDAQREQLIKATASIRTTDNWRTYVSGQGKQWDLQYRQGRSRPGLLLRELEQHIASLDKGATSDLFYINGEWHVVRVTDVIQTPPKSLADVSSDIRQRLAPLMLREAVKKASDEARSNVDVIVAKDQ